MVAAGLVISGWAGALGQEAEEKAAECTADLANGDRLEGRLLDFGLESVKFAPRFSPEKELSIRHEVLLSLTFPVESRSEVPHSRHMLELADYSQILGVFRGFEGESVRFEMTGAGEILVPGGMVWAVRAVEEDRPAGFPDRARPEAYLLRLEDGTVLWGSLRQAEDGWFELRSGAIEARVNPEGMALLLFPQHEAEETPADVENSGVGEEADALMFTVQMANGSIFTGSSPRLNGGKLGLELSAGPSVEVDLGLVRDVMMSSGNLSGARDVLVWGPFSDEDEEMAHTVAALKKGVPEGRIVISKAQRFDSVFAGQLFRARALVVPEMEEFRDDHLAERHDGAQFTLLEDVKMNLRPLVQTFLRRGGNVVFLSVQSGAQKQLFDALELYPVEVEGSQNGTAVSFNARGRKIGLGLDGKFLTANATYFYASTAPEVEAWTETENGRSPILAKRLGRGWAILLGMDFYESNEGIDRILLNAVQYR